MTLRFRPLELYTKQRIPSLLSFCFIFHTPSGLRKRRDELAWSSPFERRGKGGDRSTLQKEDLQGLPPVVQWLDLHNFTAKVMGSIPGFGTKILQATQHDQKKKKKRICSSWEVQGKSQCFHKPTTISSKEAHGSQITDVKGFAIKMLVMIIYTLLLIQKSLLHPSKLLDCLVCLQWMILRVCIQFWAGTSVLLRALWVSGHSLNVKKRSIWCQVQWLRHKIWLLRLRFFYTKLPNLKTLSHSNSQTLNA